MAKGAPDNYQLIAVKPSSVIDSTPLFARLKHGAPRAVEGIRFAVALNTVSLFSVAGQGMIYGGFGLSVHTANQETDRYSLEVDGQELWNYNFKGCNEYNLTTPSSGALYLLKHDNTNFKYSVGVMPGITFETSFEIKYTEANGNTPALQARIVYALVI